MLVIMTTFLSHFGILVKIFLQAFGSGTPFFGVNLAVEKEGQIREGDTVFAPASVS